MLKLVVKKNMAASKTMFLDSLLFCSIFLGFSILLVTSNHMSCQESIYLTHLPWHCNDIRYQNNILLYNVYY